MLIRLLTVLVETLSNQTTLLLGNAKHLAVRDDKYYSKKDFKDYPLGNGTVGDLVHRNWTTRSTQAWLLRFFNSFKLSTCFRDHLSRLDCKFHEARLSHKTLSQASDMGAAGSLVDASDNHMGNVFGSDWRLSSRANFSSVIKSWSIFAYRSADGYEGRKRVNRISAYYAVLRFWAFNHSSRWVSHLASCSFKRWRFADYGSKGSSQVFITQSTKFSLIKEEVK